jgi:glycosyltransferase involved in cell wall biosynthesis
VRSEPGAVDCRISVVTPTLFRPEEVTGLLENLSRQTLLPFEVVIVDGAPLEDTRSERAIAKVTGALPFRCHYIRHERGTAVQRNAGVEVARGDFIAFIDDDVRLERDFLETIGGVFAGDGEKKVGGIVGYRSNQHFGMKSVQRWRWYRRLRLLSTYEPGRYDFETGFPINNNMQPPFSGVRRVDFMTTACAVWRREVFEAGLRFDPFFADYGMLEDAHFALRAGQRWELLQCGDARCEEMSSPRGRVDRRRIGFKCVVNYYYVFNDVAGPLSLKRKTRFWRYQMFELFRVGTSALRRRRWSDISELRGRIEGFWAVFAASRHAR